MLKIDLVLSLFVSLLYARNVKYESSLSNFFINGTVPINVISCQETKDRTDA